MDLLGFCPMGCGKTLHATGIGFITCLAPDCERPTAVTELLRLRDVVEHRVTLEVGGFQVIHPLRERFGDLIARCPLDEYLRSLAGPTGRPWHFPGRAAVRRSVGLHALDGPPMSNVPRLLNALRRTGRPPRVTGVVHDFASTCWGHNLTITAIQDEGLRIRAACWVGRRPRAGDQVIMRGSDRQTARYRVLDVEKAPGGDDMYHLNLLFDPRVHKGTGGIHVG